MEAVSEEEQLAQRPDCSLPREGPNRHQMGLWRNVAEEAAYAKVLRQSRSSGSERRPVGHTGAWETPGERAMSARGTVCTCPSLAAVGKDSSASQVSVY